MSFQLMEPQSFSCSFVPMSLLTLSSTLVRFLHVDLSLDTSQKSAIFRFGAKFELLSAQLPVAFRMAAFAFSGIPYPLNSSVFLAVDLLRISTLFLRIYRAYRVSRI